MSIDFISLLNNEIECTLDASDKSIKILRVQYLKKSEILRVFIKYCNKMDSIKKDTIKKIIQNKVGEFEHIEIICIKTMKCNSFNDIYTNYWKDVIQTSSDIMPSIRQFLLDCNVTVNNNIFKVSSGNEFMCKMFRVRKLESIIKGAIEDIFEMNVQVTLVYDSSLDKGNKKKLLELSETEFLAQNSVSMNEVAAATYKEKKADNKQKPKNDFAAIKIQDDDIILGKKISGEITPISGVSSESGIVVICGNIFKTDFKDTKSGKKLVIFYITDYNGSITVKCFPKPNREERVLAEIKTGVHCTVRGQAVYDTFSKEVTIMARDIIKTSQEETQDLEDEKRVELHLHTRMSAMDGMSSATSLIHQAAKWGHKAIAITDHGVVQAYPEAMEAAKKNNIKIIYGIEGYLVDDGVPIVTNCSKNSSIDDSFVVFDIETTGFSYINDKVIEIGAVKIYKGKVSDTFSSFVNPMRAIPQRIVELTSITDEMVNDAPTIENILPEFMKFCEGSILCAHNASFDVSFIRKACNDFNIEFNFSVLDTLPLCRLMIPELKRYKLDVIVKHLGIVLSNHHRAVDDARATGDILLHCFKMLHEKNIIMLTALNSEFNNNIDIKKLDTYHIIILAKNQKGIKNLYKLVSKSNLDYFYKKPRLPKSVIESFREGLIIGSACEAGQVYRSIIKGKNNDELKKIISFYDYLEIQPIKNNEFLIRNGTVNGEEELKKINNRIVRLGEENNKPVVATCDVHFLYPREEVFRKILMYGQGYDDAENQPPLYLRTTDAMLNEFSYLGNEKAREVVIKNTNLIADMVEAVKPIPDETFPPKIEGAEEDIKNMTIKKAHEIYGDTLPVIVQERVDKELNSIINNGYAVLYLIAEKLVAKSTEDGYLVGSRGSVGSSLVATFCSITEVNGLPPHYICPKCKHSEFFTDGSIASGVDLPDKVCPECGTQYRKDGFDIPFETFLGFSGDKEPDIDLNFSGEYQPVVHKYTEEIFGKGHVFRAGTIGTVAEKTAYGYVKKYITDKNISINQAEIERLTMGCTGIKRTTGQHPGGVMVVPSDNEIYNFSPIQHPADDTGTEIITTHFDYHSISGRLLKLDILGHDDPTVLRMLQDLTNINPKKVPLSDDKVLSLFAKPDALGVTKEDLGCQVGTYGLPEFGTKFVRQMLLDTKPKTFSDLVRISGLSHGTDVWINNAQYYIKEGYTTLKDCIATRDDIMMYLLHKDLPPKTAFTIMEKVRKGKGLSDEHEEIMKKYKVPEWYIESCKKIKYMFPKGHAVAYVMMAIRIAYFKVYYPKAYYTTYFTVRADDFDGELIIKGEETIKNKMEELSAMGKNVSQKEKGLLTVLELSYEMYKRGIKFLKVDIYKSEAIKFKIEEDGILLPINALQGIGANAAKSICKERENGEFLSREDLRKRTKVSRTVIEMLANHGCLNDLPETNQLSLF